MPAQQKSTRRAGARLDADRLDRELALRALTARRFAQIASLHEVTLSRARHGHPVKESTLRRIAAALLQIPPLAGSEQLLVGPNHIEES